MKKGAHEINVYSRLQGEAQWQFLARDTHSPYIDTRPLANPAIPEVREYAARCVINDEEKGLLSDIVSAVAGE